MDFTNSVEFWTSVTIFKTHFSLPYQSCMRWTLCRVRLGYCCYRFEESALFLLHAWKLQSIVLMKYLLQIICEHITFLLQWRHNERGGVSNHQRLDYLLNRLFRRRSKKTSKLRGTALCEGNSPATGEFPAQRASNAENVSIWWRHHVIILYGHFTVIF